MNTRFVLITTLILIVFLSLFSRLWHITRLPPSLFSDEVDAGYQAMVFNSNKTDYFGNKFPLHFHSFSDWRTSANIYSISLVDKLIHTPELSVRLPSAIFGLISIFLIFLITKSPVASFLLAISPWAIHYNRTGFEVSGMLTVILAGIYFFQMFIQKKQLIFLFISLLFFCLSPYFYSTAKVFLPIVIILLFLIWTKELFSIKLSKLLVLGIFFTLLILPMAIDTIQGKSGFRFSYISIFTQPHREQITDTLRYQDALVDHPNEIGVKTTFISKVFHNKFQLILQRFINNYISSFSTDFLIIRGDNNLRHGFGGFGLIYIVDIVFIFIGIFSSFFQKIKNKLSIFFFFFLLLSPLPYSLTRDVDSPHSTRLILMLPALIYFSNLGIQSIIRRFKFTYIPILIIYLMSFYSFFHFYNYHYPQESARLWHTGIKEAIITTNQFSNNPIIFSDTYEPILLFYLFYKPYKLPINSSITQHLVSLSNSSFNGQVLGNQYYFGHINWGNTSLLPSNSIFVVPKSEFDVSNISNINLIEKISKKYINQEEFIIFSFK